MHRWPFTFDEGDNTFSVQAWYQLPEPDFFPMIFLKIIPSKRSRATEDRLNDVLVQDIRSVPYLRYRQIRYNPHTCRGQGLACGS